MADLLFDLFAVPRREKKYRIHDIDLTNFSEDELKSRFRFGRDSIIFLVELLREDLERPTSRNHALSPTVQVLAALRFFASGSFLQVIGDTVGLPKSTVSRTIRDVSAALIQKRNEFIHWPTTADEIQRVKEGFLRKGGFPGVIGCVDGTHIRLQRPSQNEADYVNRKGYHSINVQAICDHRGEKLEIFFHDFLGENMLWLFFYVNLSIKTFLTRFIMCSARLNRKYDKHYYSFQESLPTLSPSGQEVRMIVLFSQTLLLDSSCKPSLEH